MHFLGKAAVLLLPVCASAAIPWDAAPRRRWPLRGGDAAAGEGPYDPQPAVAGAGPPAFAADAQRAPLPEGWIEYFSDDGVPYYHHAASGVTQWDAPQASAPPAEAAPQEPAAPAWAPIAAEPLGGDADALAPPADATAAPPLPRARPP